MHYGSILIPFVLEL